MGPLRMPNTRTGLLGVSALLSVPFTWFLMYYLVNGVCTRLVQQRRHGVNGRRPFGVRG